MVFTAPAKLNLYLKVIRKMDDGYHEIETLFERISLLDHVTVDSAKDRSTITCDDPRVPTDENSLLGRALRAFVEKAGGDRSFRVSLEKNIPIGGGLGGGSSDCAALLKGLNEMSAFPLEDEALLEISRQLGADIPFFLSDCSFGIGTGRGDMIKKLEKPVDIRHILVVPPLEVLSGDVYGKVSAFDLTKDMALDRMFSAFLNNNNIIGLAENLRNDLQAIVLRDLPVLEQVFFELRKAGAKGTLMSGSGPAVFGIFDRDAIEKAENSLRQVFPAEENWRVLAVRTY